MLNIKNGSKFRSQRSNYGSYSDSYLIVFEILRTCFCGVPDNKSCRFIKIGLNLADFLIPVSLQLLSAFVTRRIDLVLR